MIDLEGEKVDDIVADKVVENILRRKRLGLIRYGKSLYLSSSDGRNPIKEAREEAEDLVIYLTWAEGERERLLGFVRDVASLTVGPTVDVARDAVILSDEAKSLLLTLECRKE